MLRKVHRIRVGERKSSPISILFYTLYLLSTTSCGITTYPVLYKPIASNFSSNPVTFQHDYRNNPDAFLTLGYDIYYRIYDDDALGTSYDSTIQSDASSELTQNVVGALINKTWDLNQIGNYRRIYLDDSSLESLSPPNYRLSISTSSNFYIYITINSAENNNSYITNSNDSNKIYFKRLTFDSTGNPVKEDFTINDFTEDDEDIPSAGISNFRIAFFAITYGLSTDYLSLHSDVVYIGSVVVQ